MSELGDQLREEVKRIMDEPSEPMRIETEGVFDSELDSAGYPMPQEIDSLPSDPMGVIVKMLNNSLELMRPRSLEPIKSEYKVKIFRLPELMAPAEIESVERAIESFLNDGYCCHLPTVINDYVIMDFSRRKDDERQERQTNNDGSDKETTK